MSAGINKFLTLVAKTTMSTTIAILSILGGIAFVTYMNDSSATTNTDDNSRRPNPSSVSARLHSPREVDAQMDVRADADFRDVARAYQRDQKRQYAGAYNGDVDSMPDVFKQSIQNDPFAEAYHASEQRHAVQFSGTSAPPAPRRHDNELRWQTNYQSEEAPAFTGLHAERARIDAGKHGVRFNERAPPGYNPLTGQLSEADLQSPERIAARLGFSDGHFPFDGEVMDESVRVPISLEPVKQKRLYFETAMQGNAVLASPASADFIGAKATQHRRLAKREEVRTGSQMPMLWDDTDAAGGGDGKTQIEWMRDYAEQYGAKQSQERFAYVHA